jgi:hypothetical protein
MNKDTILGIIRHLATYGGGVLTSKGLASADDISTGAGALVALIGVVWSILQKRAAAKALAAK